MKLKYLGLFGVISLISYTLMVFVSPIAYPGYSHLAMAVSNLSAADAPSKALAERLNCFFGPGALICLSGCAIDVKDSKSKTLRIGILLYGLMQIITSVGYGAFPWVESEAFSSFQNVMHLGVTILVVLLSIASMILITISARHTKNKILFISTIVCLSFMFIGAIGSKVMPSSVFGLFERFSTFSVVIYTAILGLLLFFNRLSIQEDGDNN